MKYIDKIYDDIPLIENKTKLYKTDNMIRIRISGTIFTSESLYEILIQLKGIKKRFPQYTQNKITLLFDFGNIIFSDKVTYLLLDIIFFDLCKNNNFEIALMLEFENSNFVHNGFESTAIARSITKDSKINRRQFIDMFNKNYHSLYVYRRIILRDSITEKDNEELPSKIGTDISMHLGKFFIDQNWVFDIAEAVSELIDNAIFHSDGDILIDVDICDVTRNSDNVAFRVVDIALISLASNLLFDKIKHNITNMLYDKNDKIYKSIYRAYENHKSYFDDYYNENDYFLITTFQNYVTTRYLKSGTNGTGLTNLIENIIETTEEDFSYVLSGCNILRFQQNCLKIDNGFIGFNKSGNYICDKPDEKSILKSKMHVPGTIFNIQLIKEV